MASVHGDHLLLEASGSEDSFSDSSDSQEENQRRTFFGSSPSTLLIAAGVLLGGAVMLLQLVGHYRGASAVPAFRSAAAVQLTTAGAPPNASVSAQQQAASLAPQENLHDGNQCADNEELYGGLCYKKCSLLTSGAASTRTSSWTCCEDDCNLASQHGSVGTELLCSGYDVNGEGGCPHAPGVCLTNEELHVGVCYKKCSVLTGGEYAHRTGAATCCRQEGFGCLDLMNDLTRPQFNVGGGVEDEASPHSPDVGLTEQGDAGAGSGEKLAPTENRTDGNICDDQEELYAGLCYKKCSLLTNGEAPIRTSTWTCCRNHPCGLSNQRGSVGGSVLCGGFGVNAEGSCPHPPGVCLTDEEFSLGVCYQKCSVLTNGAFPFRYSAVTCCKTEGVGCLNPMNLRSRPYFAVGGGAGDHNHDTPSLPHSPQQDLAEAS